MPTAKLRPRRRTGGRAALALAVASLLAGTSAHAEDGFQLNRHEPTPAGTPFFSADYPWYSSTRVFAGGITLDYSHNPLVLLAANGTAQPIVGDQLVGHVDLAGALVDRVQLSLSWPITFVESGNSAGPGVAPVSSVAAGDPRAGIMLRLYGQPRTDAFSAHLGAQVWIPVQTAMQHAGDPNVRFLPKLVLGGITRYLRWSLSVGYLVRSTSRIGPQQTIDGKESGGNVVGDELQLVAGLGYVNASKRLTLGPEVVVGTLVTSGNAFQRDFTSLELLVGLHYLIRDTVLLGVGGGGGWLGQVGTPDGRFLFRVAYAPQNPPDSDSDGIRDAKDACPSEAGPSHTDPQRNGCPVHDRDKDGVADEDEMCADEPQGEHGDPRRPGCPARDSDGDTVLDYEDECPEIAQGQSADANHRGCPLPDRDGDGVLDAEDQCPDAAPGDRPDGARRGCPLLDRDADGVADGEDACPDVAAGVRADRSPGRAGCPEPDRDQDTVGDALDACPDKPGAPSRAAKKRGCPGLVLVRNGRIVLRQPVLFAPDKDVVLPKSFAVLGAVRDALAASPWIKRVEIHAHVDARGQDARDLALTERRASSVVRWLTRSGVAPDRLLARGDGTSRPIASNRTNRGRAINRRIEIHVTDPGAITPAPSGAMTPPPSGAPPSGASAGDAQSPTAAPPTGAPPPTSVEPASRGGHGKLGRGKGAHGKGKGKGKLRKRGRGKGKLRNRRR